MTSGFKKILVLSPHTDDAELGCGGAMVRFLKEGKEIFWIVFSKAFVPQEFSADPDIVLEELEESANILGVRSQNRSVYNYPVRRFPEHRQNILDKMIEDKKRINPDLVFMPSLKDIHQDHQVIAQEGLRAFKDISILGYEYPWNHFAFDTTCFIRLDEEDIKKKIEAVERYRSQKHRPYMSGDFIKNLAQVRGIQIKSPYAEAFEVIRLILR